MKQTSPNSSFKKPKIKHKNHCSKSKENKSNLDTYLKAVEKLEQNLIKKNNGKNNRNGIKEVFNQYSNIFEVINSNYKGKNISISPSRNSKYRSSSSQKHSTADLKKGVFSYKQSIIRPKLQKENLLKSQNWRTEMGCQTPVSVFGYTPQFSSNLETQQDIEFDVKRKRKFKLFGWQKLMREIDRVEDEEDY